MNAPLCLSRTANLPVYRVAVVFADGGQMVEHVRAGSCADAVEQLAGFLAQPVDVFVSAAAVRQ